MTQTMLEDLALIERLKCFRQHESCAMTLGELSALFVDVTRRLRMLTSDDEAINYDPAALRVELLVQDQLPTNVFGDAIDANDDIGSYPNCLARCYESINAESILRVGPSGDDFRRALEAQRWRCVADIAEALFEVAPRIEAEMQLKAPSAFGHPIVRLYMARACELTCIRDLSCLAAALMGLRDKSLVLQGKSPPKG